MIAKYKEGVLYAKIIMEFEMQLCKDREKCTVVSRHRYNTKN